MGLVWSRRVGSEPYYLSYEKSFEKIAIKEVSVQASRSRRQKALKAYIDWIWLVAVIWGGIAAALWGWAQQSGDVRHLLGGFYVTAVALTLGGPAVLFAASWGLGRLARALDARDTAYLRRLVASRRKMLQEIKDSTHFDKTMALLRKYDPEAQPPPAAAASAAGPSPYPGAPPPRSLTPASQLLMKTSTMAAAAAAGAGRALLPMFDSLANNMIGDNPALIEELRRARDLAEALQRENEALRAKLVQVGGAAALSAAAASASPLQLERLEQEHDANEEDQKEQQLQQEEKLTGCKED